MAADGIQYSHHAVGLFDLHAARNAGLNGGLPSSSEIERLLTKVKLRVFCWNCRKSLEVAGIVATGDSFEFVSEAVPNVI